MFDGKAFGEALVVEVRSYVDRATAPLLEEIAGLKSRLADAEAKGSVDVQAMVDEAVARIELPSAPEPLAPDMDAIGEAISRRVDEAISALPPAEKGEPGEVDEAALKVLVNEAVERRVADLPAPEPVSMPTVEELAAEIATHTLIAEQVRTAVEALPPAEPGKSVEPETVAAMVAEQVAAAVKALPPPEPGQPGIGLAASVINRDGELVVTNSKGEIQNLGRIMGKDGDPGAPGLGFDDLTVEFDGERHMTLKFARDDLEYTHHLHFATPIYRDVYVAGREYEKGDMVTWGGSLWHCNAEKTSEKPGEGPWTLAVKKGRDAKPAN